MKNIFWITGIVGVLALSSCKKDWTCECTDDGGNTSYHNIPNATLLDAKHTCDNFESAKGGAFTNCSLIE